MRYWLGPWVWDANALPTGGMWTAPPGTKTRLDLRSIDEQAQTVVASDRGLFLTDDPFALPAAYLELPPIFTTLDLVHEIEARLGVGPVRSRTPSAFITECLMGLSDPEGVTFAKPLMPDHTGVLRHQIDVEPFAQPVAADREHFGKVIAVLRHTYRDLRGLVLAGLEPPDTHRRALSVWAERLNVRDTSIFIPSDLPVETPLPHQTQIFDDFDNPDSTNIGHQLGWGEYRADGSGVLNAESWSTVSSHIVPVAAASSYAVAIPNLSLSSDDQTAWITINMLGVDGAGGPAVRVRRSGTALQNYTFYGLYWSARLALHRIIKYVDGVATELGATSAPGMGVGPIRATIGADGSTIKSSLTTTPGTSPIEVVDTAITGYTATQVYLFQPDLLVFSWMDDFQAQDITPASICLRFSALQPSMTFAMHAC